MKFFTKILINYNIIITNLKFLFLGNFKETTINSYEILTKIIFLRDFQNAFLWIKN